MANPCPVPVGQRQRLQRQDIHRNQQHLHHSANEVGTPQRTTTLASNNLKARALASEAGVGNDSCPSSLGLACVSWEYMDWRFPVKSAAVATTASKGVSGIAARVESGNSTTVVLEVISYERISGTVFGLVTIDIEPFTMGSEDCFGASLHVFPNGAIADTTVHGVLDVELQRG